MSKATLHLFTGAVIGALVLGLFGRACMAGVAALGGHDHNLTFRGVMQVIRLGAVAGAIGGLLLLIVRRLLPIRAPLPGILVGGILFAASIVFAQALGRAPHGPETRSLLTFAVAGICYLLYGAALDGRLAGSTN